MSGKLIMKRKLDKTQLSLFNNKIDVKEISTSSTSSSNSASNKQINKTNKYDEDFSVKEPENKRIRCDTPPAEDLDSPQLPQVNAQNRHLLEAIQLKMLELQNELDAFENDVKAHEEDHYYVNKHHNQPNNRISPQEAEALGFAMCAQETMLFLQREGIPSDSLLYTRLCDGLVGRSEPDRIFHV